MRIVSELKNNKENILTGEIGALLHDIGKMHPDFIGTNSIENNPEKFYHANIDGFMAIELLNPIKSKQLGFRINKNDSSIYNLITEHHNGNTNDEIVKFLQGCDKKDSADDKGIVRKKQHLDDTWISSPFGYQKEKIDLDCLQKRFEDLEDNLSGLFKNYISGTIDLSCFRTSLINNLKTAFSHALGETREPANDVTLWDHSYSTASLFKSVLAAIACGANPNPQNLKWRIFGICWDGLNFVNKGRKIAEIKERSEIVKNIKKELKRKFEDGIPIGNAIYEDLNGIYFTFPDLNDKSKELAKECAEIALKVVYKESENELWPFFTLSKASSTLTIIANELKFASEKRKIPRMTPTLFVSKNSEKDKEKDKEKRDIVSIENDLDLESEFQKLVDEIKRKDKDAKIDVCPICRLRPKHEKKERCEVCEKRREGRLDEWKQNRENTIWIDEVADKNNRIALISLNFNIDKWLDGTMIGTIYSQSFEDWKSGKRYKEKAVQNILKDKKISQTGDLKLDAFNIADWIVKNPKATEIKPLLECFMEDGDADNVPEDVKSAPNILLSWFFTQNPSPARLYRIWKETSEFSELVTKKIKEDFYSLKWKRISFTVDNKELKSEINLNNFENTPLIIKIEGLEPENILVIHTTNGQFYTIESLDKFKCNNKSGVEAVVVALNKGIRWIAKEDEPDENLLKDGQKIKVNRENISKEDYYPVIEITRSPLFLRLIVPASDSVKILELIVKLYNERFERVLGKLPLNVGLLVSKRKFPLYVLLDAGERLFHSKEFKEPVMMDVWWEITGLREDKYYGFYPVRKLNDNEKYNLDDLAPLSKGKPYALYPGYFDFDLLIGTQDRFNIAYRGRKRVGEDYDLFSDRPYYFYHILKMVDLWEILKNNISSSQINFIEESLTNKLKEWRCVEDSNKKDVFRKFTEATIKNAFADNWSKLRKETQDLILNSALNGLLPDTIALFRHIIKEKEDEENE